MRLPILYHKMICKHNTLSTLGNNFRLEKTTQNCYTTLYGFPHCILICSLSVGNLPRSHPFKKLKMQALSLDFRKCLHRFL